MIHKGFTVVELIVVIVVIGILASTGTVTYLYMREGAQDTSIKAAVKTAGDAIQLHESQTDTRITGIGYFNAANGVDTLAPAYLKQGYRADLKSKNVTNNNNILKWYNCTGGGFVIYASLNNPSADNISNFNSTRTACGHSDTQAPASGTTKFNYAQRF